MSIIIIFPPSFFFLRLIGLIMRLVYLLSLIVQRFVGVLGFVVSRI